MCCCFDPHAITSRAPGAQSDDWAPGHSARRFLPAFNYVHIPLTVRRTDTRVFARIATNFSSDSNKKRATYYAVRSARLRPYRRSASEDLAQSAKFRATYCEGRVA